MKLNPCVQRSRLACYPWSRSLDLCLRRLTPPCCCSPWPACLCGKTCASAMVWVVARDPAARYCKRPDQGKLNGRPDDTLKSEGQGCWLSRLGQDVSSCRNGSMEIPSPHASWRKWLTLGRWVTCWGCLGPRISDWLVATSYPCWPLSALFCTTLRRRATAYVHCRSGHHGSPPSPV